MAEKAGTVVRGKVGISDRVTIKYAALAAGDTTEVFSNAAYNSALIQVGTLTGSPTTAVAAYKGDLAGALSEQVVEDVNEVVVKRAEAGDLGWIRGVLPDRFWSEVTFGGGTAPTADLYITYFKL